MEVILKILAGVAGSLLTYYITIAGIKHSLNKETDGKLFFGGFQKAIAVVCSVFSLGMIWVLLFTDHGGQEIPIFLLIGMFSIAAIYCWAEVIWTKGYFNNNGMGFQSLWGGRRDYKWHELDTVSFNEYLYWYVLKFKQGKPVRISVYLQGHGDLLNKIENMGHRIE